MREEKFDEFYNYIIKMLSIAKIGLIFSKDEYALSNYKEIESISMKMLENFEHTKFNKHTFFERNIYPTPNMSVRVAVFNEKNEILLVREVVDGGYSLPGGWCDLYDSVRETAENECMQEAGIKIKDLKFIGVFNRTPFKQIPDCKDERRTVPEYAFLIKAKMDGEFKEHEYETDDVRFFKRDALPENLSRKVSKEEWMKLINCAYDEIITIE